MSLATEMKALAAARAQSVEDKYETHVSYYWENDLKPRIKRLAEGGLTSGEFKIKDGLSCGLKKILESHAFKVTYLARGLYISWE